MSKSHCTERPILFSGPMVRAILEGRKSQTRRVVKWKPYSPGDVRNYNFSGMDLGFYMTDVPSSGYVLRTRGGGGCWNDRTKPAHCPYGKAGDRLWVRETWRPILSGRLEGGIDYRADDPSASGDGFMPWHPSIHMPRRASRLTLEIIAIRVERLQSISDADKSAEGATPETPFGTVWKRINTKPGIRWEDNPWVWVVEFKRVSDANPIAQQREAAAAI